MSGTDFDTSGASFIEFWEFVSSAGLMKVNTARAFGGSARQVLGVEDDWRRIDLSSLDVERLIERFKNLRVRDYKQETLNVYGRRFKRARELFLDYLDHPEGWRPKIQRDIDRDRDFRISASGNEKERGIDENDAESDLMTYPFPLRDNCVVQLKLPMDLSERDVGRLHAFLQALIME